MTIAAALRSVVSEFCRLEGSLPNDSQESYHLVSAAIHQFGVAIRQAESAGLDSAMVREILEPAIALHAQSPLIHRLQSWPRGYPGDFETIEYLCSAENHAQVGTLSFYIEQVALHNAVTQQHRNKVAWQASEILGVSLSGSNEKRVLSIACGGSRDLRSVQSLLVDTNIQIFLNDMDSDALALSTSSLQMLADRLTVLPGDVVRATRGFVRAAPFDLIVAGGLFDYLDDRRLAWLIPKLHACLRTDGAMCFTNLAKGNPARAWMEYLCNWSIIERSEEDVLQILNASGLNDYCVTIERDTTGLALLVKVRSTPGCRGPEQRTAAGTQSETPFAPAPTAEAPPLLQIAVANSDAERNEIYRFRYNVLVTELHRQPSGVDAEAMMVREPWDHVGVLIYASQLGTVVGTMRRNTVAAIEMLPALRDAFQFDRFLREFVPASLTISSQPVLTSGVAGEQAAASLYSYHYQALRDEGIQFDFVYAPPAAISSYEQLGYRRYGTNFLDATHGLRVPMVLVVEDIDHLQRIRSPVLKRAPPVSPRTDAAEWFSGAFPKQNRFFNRRTLERSAFWSMWGSIIRESSPSRAQLFAGVTDAEAQLFLHESSIHRFSAGETVVRAGDVGDEMFVVLSGVAEAIVVEDGESRLFRGLQHGDVFGEVAMFLNSVRSAYVRAITDVEDLVISKEQLTDNLKTMPRIASQVLLNLVRGLCARLVENSAVGNASAIEDFH